MNDVAAATVASCTVPDNRVEVPPPAAEVVVDVDDRHSGTLRALLEALQRSRHRERAPQERGCLGEGELVDDIHEEQCDRARVGGAPVEAATLSPSLWGPHANGAFFGSPS